MANLNSSAISEHRLCLSFMAFLRLFQQNSSMATMMARARPHSSTTNTPPMFCTLRGWAFESLLLSCKQRTVRQLAGANRKQTKLTGLRGGKL